MNALRFAIDYPHRITRLLIAATFASYRANPAALDFAEMTSEVVLRFS
jgi:homoserine acetyltransferase